MTDKILTMRLSRIDDPVWVDLREFRDTAGLASYTTYMSPHPNDRIAEVNYAPVVESWVNAWTGTSDCLGVRTHIPVLSEPRTEVLLIRDGPPHSFVIRIERATAYSLPLERESIIEDFKLPPVVEADSVKNEEVAEAAN